MARLVGYSKKSLRELGSQRRYSGDSAREVAFPIGGIGTGCVSLSGTGELVDWEIFNRPNKGSYLPNSFFMLRAEEKDGQAVTKVLQGPALPSFTGTTNPHHGRFGDGLLGGRGIGLPHMSESVLRGEYPIAYMAFEDKEMPVEVSFEAFNPFIPLQADDSSIPAAVFRFLVYNPGKRPVKIALAASLMNAAGYEGIGPFLRDGVGQTVNRTMEEGDARGILMTTAGVGPEDWRYGSMALATSWPDVAVQACWERTGWFDALQRYWDEFSATGSLSPRAYDEPSGPGARDTGALALRATLGPGEWAVLPVYVTWHFPTYHKYWGQSSAGPGTPDAADAAPTWKNYYASLWSDAWDVAKDVAARENELYSGTKAFRDALFDSTLPWYVLDAVSSQMSILKSPTCLRLEDGTFYGFEGTCAERGCCEGSCTHVWNYAQALPFLFPSLERSMREADYRYNQREDGWMGFRLQLPLGTEPKAFHAAADGQMGGILKTYRDWKLSGDDGWLRGLWPRVRNALEYAWTEWDRDRDGVMEGIQHNTYDIEFHGPNTMMGTWYLGALRAAEEMARYLGEEDVAEEYHVVYASGRKKMEKELFNGEYYVQRYDPGQAPRYQYGQGCLADQVIGQWFARVAGLGDLLNPRHVRKALEAIYKHNWRTDFRNHACCQRIYALNDDKGLLLCTWPNGDRPAFPFPYSDEVWCGIEYQVSSHMIYEGLVDEGLCIVRGVRERHDGVKRNPWNEFECGSHYARSMAAWSVLTALAGFSYDVPHRSIGFAPRLNEEDFRTFWSVGTGWGMYHQSVSKKRAKATLAVAAGQLELKTLKLGAMEDAGKARVELNGKRIKAKVQATPAGVSVQFEKALRLEEGAELYVRLEAENPRGR